MKADVLRFCREQQLMQPGDHVICAVSGGADSMAMLCCLRALREELGITVSVAHFNHKLRGSESDGDEAFVRGFCEENGIPLICGAGNAAQYAQEHGVSVEEAARNLRYAFFAGLDGLIATAHTADDNAETVLMHLVRGAGLRGLAGIPPKRGSVVRPMLCVTREDVTAFLRKENILWREDSTNEADFCRRNRIRHHVIPLLKEENPSFSRTVLAESLLLRKESAYLEEQAADAARQAKLEDGYDCGRLRQLPDVLLRRVLILLLRGREIPWDQHHIGQLCELLFSEETTGQRGLPEGWTARKDYGVLRFLETVPEAMDCHLLPVPGSTDLPELEMRVVCSIPEPEQNLPHDCLLLDAEQIAGPITVRARKTGDFITLPGGQRSVKRLMIDRKIPVTMRNRLPVLVMGETVLAVYSLGVSREYLPKPGKKVLAIQFQSYR